MTKITGLYTSIYEKLKKLQDELDAVTQYDSAQLQMDEALRQRRIENLKEQLEKIDDYMAKAEYFRLLSEKNLTSKNILTIMPRELNFTRLRNWAMMMDPTQKDDPYAKRIYVQSCCNMLFLENKKAEFTQTLEELENKIDHLQQDAQRQAAIAAEKERLTEQFRKVLGGTDVAEFASALTVAHAAQEQAPVLRSMDVPKDLAISLGICARALPIPEEIRYVARGIFGENYDAKNSCVFLPVEYPAEEERIISVSCASAKAKRLYTGVQKYLLNLLASQKVGEKKIYVLDSLHFNNTALGCLRPLEGTPVMESIPRSPEQLLDVLKQIVSEFADIDEEIGLADSVKEYNESVAEEARIARKVLVLIGYPRAFSSEARNYIQRILLNHEHYGVTMVLADTQYIPKKEREQESVLAGENRIHVTMLPKQELIRVGEGRNRDFKWYTQTEELSEAYVDTIQKYEGKCAKKGTKYVERVDMNAFPAYECGKKTVCVPYGVDNKDQVHSISFENENFASYLMGASGSGKSTLLHTIITGILANYHPDDVELWLADFKMSEFAQYIDPLPPHVKYILLDESRELVYDLIDKLTEKMMERQRFFMTHRDLKKVENVPGTVYMPVIFVILDEFSIMSQAVEQSETYKLKLQNILAKGRALGIKFIFASQEFTKGVSGLTSTAKEQIQMRLAMKNSYNEIDQTLELSSATKTDQVRNWMDALPPHVVLTKYRENDRMLVRRLAVMYFAGKGNEAYEPQTRLIRKIKDGMQAVDRSGFDGTNVHTYVEKEPVIVDGNHYDGFCLPRLREEFDIYRSSHSDEISPEDKLLAVGTPRRMMRFLPLVLSQESRENLLLVARAAERAAAMSVILSTAKSFAVQGGNVQIWAYGRDRIYRTYKNSYFSEYTCVEGIDDVCNAIRHKKEQMDQGVKGNDLIILLGIDQICGDFEFYKSKPSVSGRMSGMDWNLSAADRNVSADLTDYMAVTEEEQQKVDEVMDAFLDFEPIAEQIEDEGLDAGLSLEEIEAEIEKAREKFLREQAQKSSGKTAVNAATKTEPSAGVSEGQKNVADNKNINTGSDKIDTSNFDKMNVSDNNITSANDRTKDGLSYTDGSSEKNALDDLNDQELVYGAYNATEDFKSIVSLGSRQGYHFMVVLGDYSDLKQTKLNLNLFRHRMAFSMAPEDSQMMFGTTRAACGLPEHICQYTNRMESFSFRPYIHPGIGWNGWEADADGDVYNTYEQV